MQTLDWIIIAVYMLAMAVAGFAWLRWPGKTIISPPTTEASTHPA